MLSLSLFVGVLMGLLAGVAVGLNVGIGTKNINLGCAAGLFTLFTVWPLFTTMGLSA